MTLDSKANFHTPPHHHHQIQPVCVREASLRVHSCPFLALGKQGGSEPFSPGAGPDQHRVPICDGQAGLGAGGAFAHRHTAMVPSQSGVDLVFGGLVLFPPFLEMSKEP